MDSDPPDVPISNIPTLKLGSKHVVGNRPHPTQPNPPFKLFSLANTQTHSRVLTENEGSGRMDGQTTKRFGASPVWNTRRQPFALQARRTNQSETPAMFGLDGAHTSSNTIAYPSKMVDQNERHRKYCIFRLSNTRLTLRRRQYDQTWHGVVPWRGSPLE